MARILIVEDELRIRRILTLLLLKEGHEVVEAETGEQGLARLDQFAADLLLLDINLPEIDGLEVLRRLGERERQPAVLMMTAYGSIASAVEAMRLGAFDYITKPFNNDALLLVMARALEMRRLSGEVETLRTELESLYGFNEIIGISQPIKDVFRVMAKVAPVNATVLIQGESGTGKELVARAIHRRSPRAAESFVAINCSAIPSHLVESEFFGHEKGAFTDAHSRRVGRFEEADRGTLFMDEVGDLALDAQAKLLRALQERQIQPVGGGKPKGVDVRVIAATNKDLSREVSEGRFREDLFWRLNVVPIRLPPLRQRSEDLPLLIDHFLAHFNRDLGLSVETIDPDARRLLLQYAWPGNVRELENALCRSMILCDGKVLAVSDLPNRIRGDGPAGAAPAHSDLDEMKLTDAVREAAERLEKRMIASRLEKCRGNRTETAESLGISRKTLFNKLRQYRLELGS
jgi:DNA-binding NtrC family response regulator